MSLADDVRVPIRHADRFFIGGQWVQPSSDATIKVVDSGTEQLFFSVAEAQAADISRAVEAARQAFDTGPWPWLSHAERAGYVRAIGAELVRRGEDIGQIWPREAGVLHGPGVGGGGLAGSGIVHDGGERGDGQAGQVGGQGEALPRQPGADPGGGLGVLGRAQQADQRPGREGLASRSPRYPDGRAVVPSVVTAPPVPWQREPQHVDVAP
jgi:hypothetical protein